MPRKRIEICPRCGVRPKRKSYCGECWRAYQKARYAARGDNARAEVREAARARRMRDPDGSASKLRVWKLANAERVRAYQRDYYHRGWKLFAIERAARTRGWARRRATAAGAGVGAVDWLERVEEFGGACAYCLRTDLPLTLDHFRPISKGGEHEQSNVVPACKSCNSAKNRFLIFQWLPRFSRRDP